MPVVAAERAAGQTKLHDVEELAIAGIDLQLAVMKHVIGAADARSNLVAPAKVKIGEAAGIESRVLLVVQADADVQGKTAIAHGPGVLKVQSLVCRFRGACVGSRVTARVKVTVLTHAEPTSIACLDRVAGRGTGNRGVGDTPGQPNFSSVRCLQDVIALLLPEVSPLEAVAARKISGEIRHVGIEALALVRIEERGEVTRDVRKPRVIERGVRREWIVIDVSGCGIQWGRRAGFVNVPNPGRRPARRVVGEEIAVTTIDQQCRCGIPIAAEAVHRRRVHRSYIRPEARWIDSGSLVHLPECAIRRAELAGQPRIRIVPASKQTHGIR